MARTRTRDEIENAARALADMADSSFVSQAQAVFWIDNAIADLWDKITMADPQRYLQSAQFTTTPGTKDYTMSSISASDFYKAMGVDLVSGDRSYTLQRFNWNERNDYQYDAIWLTNSMQTAIRYDIREGGVDGSGTKIHFEPDPNGQTFKLWYIQEPQKLSTGASTFDGVAGWEDWVIYTVAAQMLQKEESDPTFLLTERARIEQRIQKMARDRDASLPLRVTDTRTYRPQGPRHWS